MTKSSLKSLPVMTHHFISDWDNSISVRPSLFEEHLKTMSRHGFRGVGAIEAYEFLKNGRPLPKGSVLITFDDGYLDNYVYAAPLMEQYGHKGIVFAVTAKLDEATKIRSRVFPSLVDVRCGKALESEIGDVDRHETLDGYGFHNRRDMFMNWEEASLLDRGGILAVEGHSLNHRSVFAKPDFEDFYQPRGRSRTFDRIDQNVIYGLPCFKEGPALATRAFRPSDGLYEKILGIVPQDVDEAQAFFSERKNVNRLTNAVKAFSLPELGRYETRDEFRERIGDDFRCCMQALESRLGRKSRHFCWPWGVYSQDALEVGREAGFEVFYTVSPGANLPGRNFEQVCRFKAKSKNGSWLLSRLIIYSVPLAAKIYAALRM